VFVVVNKGVSCGMVTRNIQGQASAMGSGIKEDGGFTQEKTAAATMLICAVSQLKQKRKQNV